MILRHLCLALVAALPVLAQDYEIRLHHPQRVGSKNKVSATGRDLQEMSMWSEGRALRQEKKELSVEMDAVSTVLAVGPKGKPTSLSLQIQKLTKMDAGIQKDLLPRDTVVTASRAGKKTSFEMNGQAVEPDVAQALELVITVGNPELEDTDDDLFGTRERKRVGDSWDANQAAVAKLLMSDPRMTVKDIIGKATLKELIKDASGQRLLVAFEVTGKTVPANPAPGASQGGTIVMKGTAEFPLDTSLPRVKETAEMNLSARMTGKQNPNGPEVERRMTLKRSNTANITPIN
jgi:hypothetical protein